MSTTHHDFVIKHGLSLADNTKIKLGSSDDLQIYHDGSDSFIDDAGTGALAIRASTGITLGKYTGETMASFIQDGAVTLNYDNAARLATTSSGVTVTGGVTASSVTSNGSVVANNLYVYDDIGHANDSDTYISFDNNTHTYYAGGTRLLDFAPGSVIFNEGGGDVDFRVEGVGSSHALFVQGSDSKVGIGTTSPSKQLTVSGADAEFLLSRTGSYADTITMGMPSGVPTIVGGTDLAFGGTGTWTEHMRIKADGKVGIGTTAPSAPLSLLDASLTTQGTGEGGLRVHRPNASSQYGYFDYSYNGGGVNIGSLYTGGSAASFGTFTFRQHSNGATQIPMFISNTGNVGIGTTAPTHPLHVAGDIRINVGSALKLYNSAGNGWAQIAYEATNDAIQVQRKIVASTNNSLDLGTSSLRWANVYAVNLDVTNFSPTNIAITSGTVKLDGDFPTGSRNVALGDEALSNVSGSYNVAIGSESLKQLTSGGNNTAVGRAAAQQTTGSDNTAMGNLALYSNTSGGSNTAVGKSALTSNTTATGNTAVGEQAAYANTTGGNLAAFGRYALYSNTTGSSNTAIGFQSLFANTTGGTNSAVGYQALHNNTTASHNTALGWRALFANTTGDLNVAIGYEALDANTTGDRNVAVGTSALTAQTASGDTYNTAVGYAAGASVTTGVRNTFIGGLAGDANQTTSYNVAVGSYALTTMSGGGYNTAVGDYALGQTTTGSSLVAVGQGALQQNTTGTANIGIGQAAGAYITTGVRNIIIGATAGDAINTGRDNIAIGYLALSNETKGDNNVAIGSHSLQTQNNTSNLDSYNTAVGYNTGYTITTGIQNTLVGGLSGDAITTGNYNTALGYTTLSSNTTGARNTAIGSYSLNDNTTGESNTALGISAIQNTTTGSYNTGVGDRALDVNTTGSYNTAIGMFALRVNTTASYNTAVGYNSLSANTTGAQNVSVGQSAGMSMTTGSFNTLIGDSAGAYFTTGGNNVALGQNALRGVTSGAIGQFNTALGRQTMQELSSGSWNVAIGYQAGINITTGYENTLIGGQAGDAFTVGLFNVALGHRALQNDTTGRSSIAIGHQALFSQNFTGNQYTYNIAIGNDAGSSVTTGTTNTIVGSLAARNLTVGNSNVAIGYNALAADTKGDRAVAVGLNALASQNFTTSTDNYNVGVGYQAGYAITTGVYNVLVGAFAGDAITDADYNTAFGHNALSTNVLGNRNTAVGYDALMATNPGSALNTYNTAVGFQAGRLISTGQANTALGGFALANQTTANNNTALGYFSGAFVTTGAQNTLVGYASGDAITTGSNNAVFGYAALGANTTGGNNTAVGAYSLTSQSSGSNNTSMGYAAGNDVTVGTQNVFMGSYAGANITSAPSNTAIGYYALQADTQGRDTVAIGVSALATQNFTSSTYSMNVAVGNHSGHQLTTGQYNTFVGARTAHSHTTGQRNTFLGNHAGYSNTTASYNTFVGDDAGIYTTTGANNSYFGAKSGQANTTGNYNVGIGMYTLSSDTTGGKSTALGYGALYTQNTTSSADMFNTAVGFSAGNLITTGTRNTLVGSLAGDSITTGGNNVALGADSLGNVTTQNHNVAIGRASQQLATGTANVAIGTDTLENASGGYNTAVGYRSLTTATTGPENVGVGQESLHLLTTGSHNTAIGSKALKTMTTANQNTAVGYYAMHNNTTGSHNTAVGRMALYHNTTGQLNVAVGYNALYTANVDGYNTAVGASALGNLTTGSANVALGYVAGNDITTGANNTMLGYQAGRAVTTGGANTAIGFYALYTNQTGSNNVAIGQQALRVGTAAGNTSIGHISGYSVSTGQYNVLLGYQAGYSATTGHNQTFVGMNAGYHISTGTKNVILGGYTGNNDGLDIRTATNNVVISDGDGQVKVHFASNDDAQFRGNVEARDGKMLRAYRAGNSAYAGLFLDASEKLYIRNSWGTKDIVMLRTGEVGIGTDSPNAGLEVLKAGGGKIRISETAARYVEIIGYAEGTANGSTMAFQTVASGSSTNTERMRINSNGQVGIGTNSPDTNASVEISNVAPNTGVTTLRLTNAVNNKGQRIDFEDDNAARCFTLSHDNGSNITYMGTLVDESFAFYSNSAERMRITNAGNVGIGGTSSINSKLSVFADGEAFRVDGTANTSRTIRFRNTGVSGSSNAIIVSDGTLQLKNEDANAAININSIRNIEYQVTSGNATAGHHIFTSYNTEIMRIDGANNRVGIGTTAPAAKLHIEGDGQYATIRGYSQVLDLGNWTNGEIRIESTGAPFHLRAAGNQPLHLETNNVERISILGTGNVGIGIASPSRKLSIFDTVDGYNLELSQSSAYNSGRQSGVVFSGVYHSSGFVTDLASIRGGKENTNDGNYAGNLRFFTRTHGGSDTERMRIDSSGNVGIGTTSPQRKLTVVGAADSAGDNSGILQLSVGSGANTDSKMLFGIDSSHRGYIHVVDPGNNVMNLVLNPTNSSNGRIGIGANPISGHQLTVNGRIGGLTYVDSYVQFTGGNAVLKANDDVILGYSSSLYVKQGGNVGIGTSAPSAKLHVYEGSATGVNIGIQNTERYWNLETNDGLLKIQDVTAGSLIRMAFDTSGNVGIGTAYPGANGNDTPALDVQQATTGQKAAAYMRVTAQTNAAYLAESFYTGHYRDTGNGEYATVAMIGMETTRTTSNNIGGDLNFYTKVHGGANSAAPTQKMVIKHDGKVGIGTVNPATNLQVHASSSHGEIRISTAGASNSTVPALSLNNTGREWSMAILADNHLHFRENSAAYASRLTIADGGNVGIGTTNPLHPLHIEHDTSTVYDGTSNQGGGLFVNNLYHEALNTFTQLTLGVSGASGASSARLVAIEPGQAQSDFAIVLRNGSSWGEKLRIKGQTGNVGIGTDAPVTSLSFGEASTGITFLSTATNFNSGKVAGIRGEVTGTGHGNLAFDTFQGGSGGGERMVLTSGGELQLTGNGVLRNQHSSGNYSYLQQTASDSRLWVVYSQPLLFGTNNAERMRILSTGKVGIGTQTPAKLLTLAESADGAKLRLNRGGVSEWDFSIGNSSQLTGVGSGALEIIPQNAGTARELAIGSVSAGTPLLHVKPTGTGISTNPSAWSSVFRALEISSGAAVTGRTDSPELRLVSNAYLNTSNNFIYKTSNAATMYTAVSGIHIWSNAGVGTAGNTATMTERMRITGGGHVLIGKTADDGTTAGVQIQDTGQVSISADSSVPLNVNLISGASGGTVAEFRKSGTLRGSIGISNYGVAYNTTSDERLKDNIQDAPSASTVIDNIKVRQFDWNVDGTHENYGMIAQELSTVVPGAVSSGEKSTDMMGVDYSKLIPLLVKEIQELRQRVAQLEE